MIMVVMAATAMIIPAIIMMVMVPVAIVTPTRHRIPNRGQGHQRCGQGGQGKHAFHLHILSTAMDMKTG